MAPKIELTPQDEDDSDFMFHGIMSQRGLEPEVNLNRMTRDEREAYLKMEEARLKLYEATLAAVTPRPPKRIGRPAGSKNKR